MIVREAKKEDINQIVPISMQVAQLHFDKRPNMFKMKNKEETEKDIKEIFEDKEKNILVCVDNSKIVGVLIYKIKRIKNHEDLKDAATIWIDALGVSEECRRKGVGKQLMDEVIKIAQKEAYERVELNCWEFNADAIKFYESQNMVTQRRIMEIEIKE